MLKVLLPTDLSFDLAMNIFTFQPGAALPFVESHIMEHGLLMLQGSGIYRLADQWYPVQAGDVIWMASLLPAVVCGRRKNAGQISLRYKDVNRHPIGGALNESNLKVSKERFSKELDQLAALSDAPAPAVTRVLFTPMDLKGRAYIKKLAEEAGFAWREDPMGNTFIRWEGSDAGAPAVSTGSHTDAIPFSGKFDGTVGVIGGIEALRALKESGFKPKRSLEVIMFTSEEPTRFGVGCVGSRLMCGFLSAESVRALKDPDGADFESVRKAAGYSGKLEDVQLSGKEYSYFVELHIEQGPRLEASGVPIGLVTNIAASSTSRITITGDGGHAGTVLMTERRDALIACAELALKVEQIAKRSGSPDAVGTVGIFDVPSVRASNSIPSKVQLTVDFRDKDAKVRDKMLADLQRYVSDDLAPSRKVTADFQVLNCDPSSRSDETILSAAEDACAELGYECSRLVSRAYHDTVFMALKFPTAMIFVPSFKGYSHRPEEYSSPEEIERGIAVLALTMAQLSWWQIEKKCLI